MSRVNIILFTALSISYTNTVSASQEHRSEYIGQEKRLIKSLSQEDIEQLMSGKGWGLAKAAELNGVPGPSHILQMKTELSLSKAQEKKIQILFLDMQSKAIPLGNNLIELEKELNLSFTNKTITKDQLIHQLDAIANIHKQLRYVHLQAHLVTPTILTSQQIDKYNKLRGYVSGNSCKNPSKGRDGTL